MRVVLAAVCVCGLAATATAGEFRRVPRPAPGSYIVVLKPDAARMPHVESDDARPALADVAADLARQHAGRVQHMYEHALRGFSVRMSAARAQATARDARVEFVEEDGMVQAAAVQTPATWGLDRIDQHALPLDNAFSYDFTGSSVHVYVVDTGIRASHTEFEGRIGGGMDAIDGDGDPSDCHGHGTHVAATVGGRTYGVAKGVTLHGVRVLDCTGSGWNSTVIAGVDWVTANHIKPAVANMSLGGDASSALDAAVSRSISAGVIYAVAATNTAGDACNYSPARVPSALTVAASDRTDVRASFSAYGTCVDLFAPGVNIPSAWIGSDSDIRAASGTSMASPHVAGVAALVLDENPSWSPGQVAQMILNSTTPNLIGSSGPGTPNRLLFARRRDNLDPIGYLDGIDAAGHAFGWACDPDAPADSIAVEVMVRGYTFTTNADLSSEAAVNSMCGGGSAHRFQLDLPASAANAVVYAYGIDIAEGRGRLGSSCSESPGCYWSNNNFRTPIGYLDGISPNGGATGWTCDPDNYNQSTLVGFYGDGVYVGTYWTGHASEPAVQSLCGGGYHHRFVVQLPSWTKGRAITAYGVDSISGAALLAGPLCAENPACRW